MHSHAAVSQPYRLWRVHLIGAGLTIAVACLFFVLSPSRHLPELSASDYLRRAAAVAPLTAAEYTPGVIVQRVDLITGGRHFTRTLYRDRQGQRKPRLQAVSDEEQPLARRLAAAGVTLHDPLTVDSYRDWHDHLVVRTDTVLYPGSGLITISTAVGDEANPVRNQNLTMRTGSFHPVSRTIEFRAAEFRAAETVEIAELDYKVLPWSHANSDWFESDAPPPMRVRRAMTFEAATTPLVPLTDDELNRAELSVRLLLSQEEADVSEQVEVDRTGAGVVVRGTVSSEERKQELLSKVEAIANATAELSTFLEREKLEREQLELEKTERMYPPSAPGSSAPPVTLMKAVSRASPLLEYWARLHRDPNQLVELQSALLDNEVRVGQQAHAMRALIHDFASNQTLDAQSNELFRALYRDHASRLRVALADQAQVENNLAAESFQGPSGAIPDTAPSQQEERATSQARLSEEADLLDEQAKVAMAICRRLTAGADPGEASGTEDALVLLGELTRQHVSIAASVALLDPLQR